MALEREVSYLPGTLSYVGASLMIVPDSSNDRADAQREIFHVTTRATGVDRLPAPLPRTIIFARLWWPGYTARINGQPVPVIPHDNLLVRVDVPETFAGSAEIALSFRPLSRGVRPYLIPLGVALLLVGLVCLATFKSLGGVLVNGRR